MDALDATDSEHMLQVRARAAGMFKISSDPSGMRLQSAYPVTTVTCILMYYLEIPQYLLAVLPEGTRLTGNSLSGLNFLCHCPGIQLPRYVHTY